MYAGMYWVLSNWRVRPKGAGMYAGMYAYLRTQARGPLGVCANTGTQSAQFL